VVHTQSHIYKEKEGLERIVSNIVHRGAYRTSHCLPTIAVINFIMYFLSFAVTACGLLLSEAQLISEYRHEPILYSL